MPAIKHKHKPLSVYQLWILSIVDREKPFSFKELHNLFEDEVEQKTFSNFYTMTQRLRDDGLIDEHRFALTKKGKAIFKDQLKNCLNLTKYHAPA